MKRSWAFKSHINECFNEGHPCTSSCFNKLSIFNDTKFIEANNLSFLGINIATIAVCEFQKDLSSFNNQSIESEFLHLGTKHSVYYPPIQPNEAISFSFNVISNNLNGVLLYFGYFHSQATTDKDFLLLELNNGFPTLVIEFGSGELIIPSKCILTRSHANSVNIIIHENNIEINVRNGHSSSCRTSAINKGSHKVLNINTPTKIGGQNFTIFDNKLNKKSYNPLKYYLEGYLYNLHISNYNVHNNNQADEQNTDVKINQTDEQNNEVVNNSAIEKTSEMKSYLEPQSFQNTILYIIIGILVVAVVFLLLLLIKTKALMKSSFIIAHKQKQFPNSQLKETIADEFGKLSFKNFTLVY